MGKLIRYHDLPDGMRLGKKAILVLADGTVLEGKGIGAHGRAVGEVVFNTSMTGYVEALTDPSYNGQILMFTYPLIGNYAVPEHFESDSIKAEGVIVKQSCPDPNHWESDLSLDRWLELQSIPGIEGVDTRALTKKIRRYGVLPGALEVYKRKPKIPELLDLARSFDIGALDLVQEVACREPQAFEGMGDLRIGVVDCGSKMGIIRELLKRANVVLIPPRYGAKDMLGLGLDGVVISNGPGDPSVLKYLHGTIRSLSEELPILGVCLGHQLIALAMGARTYKMLFGHRGSNHPVRDLETGRIFITSQNHGYAVDADSLDGTGLVVTKVNANDLTVEGIAHSELPMVGIQYHPEASPGPLDSGYLFSEFLEMVRDAKEGGY